MMASTILQTGLDNHVSLLNDYCVSECLSLKL